MATPSNYKLLKDTPRSKAGDIFTNSPDPNNYVGPSGESFPVSAVEQDPTFFVNATSADAFAIVGITYFYLDELLNVRSNVFAGGLNFAGYPDEASYVRALGNANNLFQTQAAATNAQVAVKAAFQAQPKS